MRDSHRALVTICELFKYTCDWEEEGLTTKMNFTS